MNPGNKKESRIRKSLASATLVGATLLFFSGCATTGENETVVANLDATIPQQWKNEDLTNQLSVADQTQLLTRWWEQFDDNTLNQLINKALRNNLDLRSAILTINQARLRLGLAESQKLPSMSVSTSTSGTNVEYLDSDRSTDSESSSLSLSASWELDLFGKQNDAIRSADASMQATMEDYHGMQVSLVAEVANAYFSLRSLQSEYEILQKTLDMREQTLQITRWQEEAGEVNALAVQQAVVSFEQAKTSLPTVQQNLEEAYNALALLCGEQPGSLMHLLSTTEEIPSVPGSLVISIPAETLGQRPDIRAQRLRIAAVAADLSEAKKQRLPSLNLSGSLGLNEENWSDLLNPAQVAMNIAGRLTAPLWDANRIKQTIELQDVALEQDYVSYEKLVLNALLEVENALHSISKSKQRLQLVEAATEAARISAEIADLQYEAGEVDLLSVLESQRSLLNLEQSLINSQVQELSSHIQLFKAMGGGWSPMNSDTI